MDLARFWELECEPMLYVAFNAYHARAEAELPADSHVPQPSEPLGERWDFEVDGEVRRRRPGAVGEGGYPLGMDVGDLPDGLPPGRLLALAAPPRTREHAEHLALEHLLVCAENLWNHGDWTFPGYVDRILGADLWAFRWDD